MDSGDMPVLFSESENAIYIGCSGLTKIDINTGKKIAFNEDWPSDIKLNKDYIVCFEDLSSAWYDKTTLNKIGETDFKGLMGTTSLNYVSSSQGGERCLLYDNDTHSFIVCDVFHKSVIRTIQTTSGQRSISGNGKIFITVR